MKNHISSKVPNRKRIELRLANLAKEIGRSDLQVINYTQTGTLRFINNQETSEKNFSTVDFRLQNLKQTQLQTTALKFPEVVQLLSNILRMEKLDIKSTRNLCRL